MYPKKLNLCFSLDFPIAKTPLPKKPPPPKKKKKKKKKKRDRVKPSLPEVFWFEIEFNHSICESFYFYDFYQTLHLHLAWNMEHGRRDTHPYSG